MVDHSRGRVRSQAKGPTGDDGPIRLARPQHECGVFGIYSANPAFDAATHTYMGLYALQHRGQESAGMAVSDGARIKSHKGMGLAAYVFDDERLAGLKGRSAIGHVRYSTTGGSNPSNAQPLLSHTGHGRLAVAHNGNLVNAESLRSRLLSEGSIFQSTTDSEVIINLIARCVGESLEEAVADAMGELQGGFAVVMLAADKLIGFRDAHGIRPLCIGRMAGADVLASESCALENVGAELVREVAPGEMVVIDRHGYRGRQAVERGPEAFCSFEFVYLARPDSDFQGRNVHQARKEIGRRLAREQPAEADLVLGAPDSGTPAAIGYADESTIPYDAGLIKNRYIGRTFIQPTQAMRKLSVKMKLNPIRKVVEGRRVVIIDDSIVRGTTSVHLVRILREAGAREVHMRVASPPYLHSCYYGVDTADRDQLVAHARSTEEIRRLIGADSLGYLSLEGLTDAIGIPGRRLCTACFSGRYPTDVLGAADDPRDAERRATR